MRATILLGCSLLGTAGCFSVNPVECQESADCDLALGGTCVTADTGSRWCAYPDNACAGGLRYSDFRVGDDLAGVCVEAAPCTPNTQTCSEETLHVCDAAGVLHDQSCPMGCHTQGDRCWDLEPSNAGMTTCLTAAALERDVTVPGGSVIDTDTGVVTIPGGGTLHFPSDAFAAPPNGVPFRCFRARALDVAGDVEVRGSAAIAFAAAGAVRLMGKISVAARGPDTPGPGAFPRPAPCHGGESTGGQFLNRGGGGGGGFGAPGGSGGPALTPALGGTAGQASGTAELVPLRGGCHGGVYESATLQANGGGALQLVSAVSVTIGAGGGIDAAGWGGGRPGNPSPPLFINLGGGSGGGILIEAPSVTMESGGFLTANGGGGGGMAAGSPGLVSTQAAPGGAGDPTASLPTGRGGAGGARDTGAANGQNVPASGLAGGGGGGVGRIRVNAYVAFAPPAGATVSPIASQGQPGRR